MKCTGLLIMGPALCWTTGSRIFVQTAVLGIVSVNAKQSEVLPSTDGPHRDLQLLGDLGEVQQPMIAQAL